MAMDFGPGMAVTTRRSWLMGAVEVWVVSVIMKQVYRRIEGEVSVMDVDHHFAVSVTWQGNRGTGTSGYRDYGRQNSLTAGGKHAIEGSSARVFHGNSERWNPEE